MEMIEMWRVPIRGTSPFIDSVNIINVLMSILIIGLSQEDTSLTFRAARNCRSKLLIMSCHNWETWYETFNDIIIL